jgi:hypothetical protein
MAPSRIEEGELMPRTDKGTAHLRPRNVLAWSLLLACVLVLASLFHSMTVKALGGPAMTPSTPARLSTLTAALADGDDERARFLASIACDPSLRVCSEWR